LSSCADVRGFMNLEMRLYDLLASILPHVVFDGWSQASFDCAVADLNMDPSLAAVLAPRGAVDLAIAYHRLGDANMLARYEVLATKELKIKEKITLAVRLRLDVIENKEVVRRGSALFALPRFVGDGAKLIWNTSDNIWMALGDTSEDVNWYSKRATLSAVYAATVLFWLGDDSPSYEATWGFLDRRIENVMQIEKAKGQIRANKKLSTALAAPLWLIGKIKRPVVRDDLPGRRLKF